MDLWSDQTSDCVAVSYGDDLQAWLDVNDVSARELSVESGVSEETIRLLVTGQTSAPRRTTRQALDAAKDRLFARRAGVDADALAIAALADISATLAEVLALVREIAQAERADAPSADAARASAPRSRTTPPR